MIISEVKKQMNEFVDKIKSEVTTEMVDYNEKMYLLTLEQIQIKNNRRA